MKRAVSGTLLILLLAGILTLVLNVQLVKANGTIYIRADGSIDPLTANITTSDYVTYTFIGNITDLIIVERSNIIIDGNGYMLQGSGSGNGFYCSGINNVTIRNTNIKNFQYGIYLLESSNSSISGNNITANNYYGIVLSSSSIYNSISGNNITNNYDGIGLYSSSIYNSISGNNITNNYYGIGLESSNNSISGNNITNNWDGIYVHSSSNNSISGNNITANNEDGIRLDSSSIYNSISGNNITANNWDGIRLDSSSIYNSISGNNITANNYDGIGLYSSSIYNSISGNNITANNEYGIRLDYSSNNSISGNTFTNDGLFVYDSYQNSVKNNTVNGRPLVYLEGVSNYTIDDAGQVILVRCENIRVEGLNLSRTTVGVELLETSNSTISGNNITANNRDGIYLYSSSNNTISGNNITANNRDGIYLYSSSNNTISGNNVTANNGYGIYLYSSSIYNSISGNTITANNGYGIGLYSSSNNSISGNTITANNGYGIGLYSSSNNSIAGNTITNSGEGILLGGSPSNSIYGNTITNNSVGIWLSESSNNNISENNVTANNGYGIYLYSSSNNSIYHNHFVNNTLQVVIAYPSYANVWDDGYPSGGNYWSDYSGVDSNVDGIGDAPYIIDSNNQDRYPMVPLWNPDTTSPYITILSPQNKTYITSSIPLTFTVNEPASWIGYSLDGQANVTISGNTTLTSLSYGQHSITVYANDTSGNMGASNKVFLTVQTPPPNPIVPIRETPPPENVAVAVATGAAITVGFTGLMSLSGLGQSLNSAIEKMNIPDWLKDFLKSYSEEVFKTLTKEKIKAKKKVFTKKEIATIIFSASIITIVFGYVEANGLPQFSSLSVLAVVIPPVLSTVVVISVTDALFTALSSKTCNIKSESKVWLHGVIAFLVSGLLFLVPFASPTRSTYQCGEISKKTKGLLVLSKMLLLLTLSIPFALLFIFGFMSLGDTGLLIILTTVSYSLIPIKPLEGKEIFDFDKKVWLATFIPVLFLFLGWVLHLLPHIVYLGVGLSSAFIWAVTFRQATSKKQNE